MKLTEPQVRVVHNFLDMAKEWFQSNKKLRLPCHYTLSSGGPDGNPMFDIRVSIGPPGSFSGDGGNKNKKGNPQ